MSNIYHICLHKRTVGRYVYVEDNIIDSIAVSDPDENGCDDAYEQFSAWCKRHIDRVNHKTAWYGLLQEEPDGMLEIAYFDPNDAYVTGPDVVMFSNSVYGVVPC